MKFLLSVIVYWIYLAGSGQNNLDPAFGISGKTILNFDQLDNAVDVFTDGTGMVYLIGYTGSYGSGTFNYDYIVSRLDSNGLVDSGFGNNGIIRGDFPGYDYSTTCEGALVNDGIIIAGNGSFYSSTDSQHVFVCKFDFDGNPDSSFATNGYYKAQIQGPNNDVTCLQVQADGKILIGGATFDTAYYHQETTFISRLLPNGLVDSSFGGTGTVVWNSLNGLTSNFEAASMARHADGTKIFDLAVTPWGEYFACGYYDTGGIFRLFTLCFDENGMASSTFGTFGAYIFDINPTVHQFAVSIDSVGDKMLIGAVFQGEGQIVLQTIDQYTTLGTAQIFTFDPDQDCKITDLLSTSNSIYLSAYAFESVNAGPGYESDYHSLYRMNKDLTANTNFATNGLMQEDLLTGSEDGTTAICSYDDHIYMAGYVNDTSSGNVTDFVVSRVSPSQITNVKPTHEFLEFSVYPNPAMDFLVVETDHTQDFKVMIYDMAGSLVRITKESKSAVKLDISELSSGVYKVVVLSKLGIYYSKLTKQ